MARAQVQDAQAAIASSQAEVERLKLVVEDLTIRAPIRGRVLYRLREPGEPFVTDNGNQILDVHNLEITAAIALEEKINNLVGVVTNGLFAARPADIVLMGTQDGVETLTR